MRVLIMRLIMRKTIRDGVKGRWWEFAIRQTGIARKYIGLLVRTLITEYKRFTGQQAAF